MSSKSFNLPLSLDLDSPEEVRIVGLFNVPGLGGEDTAALLLDQLRGRGEPVSRGNCLGSMQTQAQSGHC